MALLPPLTIPALKFETPGTTHRGVLTEIGEPIQARKYSPTGDGGPDFWDEEKTRAKMQRRFLLQCQPDLTVPGDTGVRALYAIVSGKPGGMFWALNTALEQANDLGGQLTITFTGFDPESKNPQNPRKIFAASYVNPSLGQKLMQDGPNQVTPPASAPVQQQYGPAPVQQAPAPVQQQPAPTPAQAPVVTDTPPPGMEALWANLAPEARAAVLAAQPQ